MLIKKLFEKRLLFALIISFLTAIIFSVVSGFRYVYEGKDDYVMSMLIADGDSNSLFLNYFLTVSFVKIQSFFSTINVFGLSQQLNCFLSSIIIGYVFLSKYNNGFGVLLASAQSIIIFGTSIIMIQWTQTATIMCSAGLILLVHSFRFEERKRIKAIHICVSLALVIIGSFYRFTASLVCFAFFALYVFCFLLEEVMKAKGRDRFTHSLFITLKRNAVLLLAIVAVISASFGFWILSDNIKGNIQGNDEYVYYNNGRSKVTDYDVAPYEGNESFFNGIGILSKEDYNMMCKAHIDRDYYNAEKLNAVGDYSSEYYSVNNAVSKVEYALKKTIKQEYRTLLKLKEFLPVNMSNKAFLALVGIIAVLFIAFAVLFLVRARKQNILKFRKRLSLFSSIVLSLIWINFVVVFGVDSSNILFLPIMAFAVLTVYISNRYQHIFCYLFSIATITLYCYQKWFRFSFRVSCTFLLPSLFFLVLLFDSGNIRANLMDMMRNQGKKIKKGLFACAVAVSMLLTVSVESCVWSNLYIDNTVTCSNDKTDILSFFEEHPETLFVHKTSVYAYFDEAYYNPDLLPSFPDNTLNYAGWNIASAGYDRLLAEKGVTNLFEQMIDNEHMQFVLIENEDFDVAHMYEEYYNIHYAKNGKHIRIIQEKEFFCTGSCWGGKTVEQKIGLFSVVYD